MESHPTKWCWEHAHQCRVCGHVVPIDEIDAKVITTGIVICPKCEASGPVNVKIVDAQQMLAPDRFSRRQRQ